MLKKINYIFSLRVFLTFYTLVNTVGAKSDENSMKGKRV